MTITDLSNDIQLTFSNGATELIDKVSMTLSVRDNYVWIKSNNNPTVLKINYGEVSSPSVASNSALVTLLLGYQEGTTNAGGGGVSTPEELVDITDQEAGTLYYDIEMNNFENMSLHYKLVSANAGDTITMTFWATNNPDAATDADTGWVDISSDVLGAASVAANNSTVEAIKFINTDSVVYKFRVKLVIASAADTSDALIYIVKSN